MVLIVPREIIECTPSIRHGLSAIQEEELRFYGSHLIYQAGINMSLKSVTIASAQAILQRFYYRRSLTDFDIGKTAVACTFLATKLEEDPKRLREVITVFYEIGGFPNTTSNETDDLLYIRDDVLRCESYILRELGFMISQALVHPHRYILQYVYALFKNLNEYSNYTVNDMAQRAWSFLNDSSKTPLCCQVQPWVIAAGSLYLAAKSLGIHLSNECKWFDIFDTTIEEIDFVCNKISSITNKRVPKFFNIVSENAVVGYIKRRDNDTSSANDNKEEDSRYDKHDRRDLNKHHHSRYKDRHGRNKPHYNSSKHYRDYH